MPAGDLGVPDRAAGFEVCRRLKRDPRTARTPVIFVTALNDTADRVKAIEAGGDEFLTKPHNRLVLGARVRSLVKLKRATDALADTVRKLRELEKVRDDLLNMLVHDLKSPLAGVLATLEMAGDGDFGPVPPAAREALTQAQGRGEELLALIDDLLEVARLEEGRLVLRPEPLEPARLLAELARDWAVRFAAAGVRAEIDERADGAPSSPATARSCGACSTTSSRTRSPTACPSPARPRRRPSSCGSRRAPPTARASCSRSPTRGRASRPSTRS
jgi:signal transduction histidine kinase